MRRLWDISPPISPDTPAFPGDTTYAQRWNAQIGPGCPVNVSAITMSPHLGAHADAPLHYGRDASAIGQWISSRSSDPAASFTPSIEALSIRPEHLSHAADGLPPRVLVRTCVMAPTAWSPAFSAFAPETITWLARHGVRLVGIDSQSVDPADSKTLDSHQQLLAHDMRVLENLVLDEVEAGDYELIALPLKLIDADASPVRAILRSL